MAAAKRQLEESDRDPIQPNEKRIRANRPSFAAVISQVVMVKSMENFCSLLEPMLRRTVKEEVENVLRRTVPHSHHRGPALQIETSEEPSTLQFIFKGELSLPVFTGSKMEDVNGNPLKVLLVDSQNGQQTPTSVPYPIKVEIVAIDGDFPPIVKETWTSEEFNNKIVRERVGKRPLLAGDVNLTVRDGFAVIGDLSFTDNSSWIRSRNFRLAVRVLPESGYQGPRIREATTKPFVVKDHRGELYQKHFPPALDDDVWRLKKIGKEGAFHKKLAAEGINKVQDFLKMWVVNAAKLRRILGVGMADKAWEVTIKHARTCNLGSKRYIYRGHHYTILLNSICQVVQATQNEGQSRVLTDIHNARLQQLAWDAYVNWNSLEEIDAAQSENALLPAPEPWALLPPSAPGGNDVALYKNHHPIIPNHHQQQQHHHHQHGCLHINGFVDIVAPLSPLSMDDIVHAHYSDWQTSQSFTYAGTPTGNCNIYNSSDSDGDYA